MALRVRTTTVGGRCPVTLPDTENGSLVDNGVLSAEVTSTGEQTGRRQADGPIFDKFGWIPVDGLVGRLVVNGERLDVPSPPLKGLAVNWGNSFPSGQGSWASAVVFPSEGCWRLTGRVRDLSLTYVVSMRGSQAPNLSLCAAGLTKDSPRANWFYDPIELGCEISCTTSPVTFSFASSAMSAWLSIPTRRPSSTTGRRRTR